MEKQVLCIDIPATGTAPVVLTLGYIKDKLTSKTKTTFEIENSALPQSGLVLNGPDDPTAGSQYSGLGDLLVSGANTFIRFEGAGPITLSNKFIINVNTAALNVNTRMISTGSGANTALGKGGGTANGIVNIGTTNVVGELDVNATGTAIGVNNTVNFLNPDSILLFDSTNATGNSTWILNGGNIGGNVANSGVLTLKSQAFNISVAKTATESLGTKTNPLKAVNITGNQNVTINVDTYAQNTVLNTANELIINTANFNSPITTLNNGVSVTLATKTLGIGQIGAQGAHINNLYLKHLYYDTNNSIFDRKCGTKTSARVHMIWT